MGGRSYLLSETIVRFALCKAHTDTLQSAGGRHGSSPSSRLHPWSLRRNGEKMANGLQKTPDPLNVNLAEFMMKTFRGTTEEGMITPCAPRVFPSVNPIGLVLQMMEVAP